MRLSHEIFSLEPLAICVFNINTLGIYYNGSDNLVYGLVSGRCIAILLCLLWSFALLDEQVLSVSSEFVVSSCFLATTSC